MNINVHILCFNEKQILPWTLAHYQQFASRIIVHDASSTDGSREIIRQFGVELSHWGCPSKLDDSLNTLLKNNCWKSDPAAWHIVVDTDEFVYFPNHQPQITLFRYYQSGILVPRCKGYEMTAPIFPPYEKGKNLYDIVKEGAHDLNWYSKAALFSGEIRDINYGIGAHDARPINKYGQLVPIGEPQESCYLLHFKHLGPMQDIQKKQEATRARFSQKNELNGWGIWPDFANAAQNRRNWIEHNKVRVIP